MGLEVIFTTTIVILSGLLVAISFGQKGLNPVIKWFGQPHSRINKRLDYHDEMSLSLKEGQLALLHDRLYQACKHHLEKGYVRVSDLKNLEHIYEAYVKLGGNGTCEILYCRVQNLEFREDKVYKNENRNGHNC